jgi:hypothetical protein
MKRHLSLLLLGGLLILPLAACSTAPSSSGDPAAPAAEETPEETPGTTGTTP